MARQKSSAISILSRRASCPFCGKKGEEKEVVAEAVSLQVKQDASKWLDAGRSERRRVWSNHAREICPGN